MRNTLLPIKPIAANGYRQQRFMVSVPPSRTGTSRVRRFFVSWTAADEYRRKVHGPGGFLAAETDHKQVESTAQPLDFCVRDWLARVYESNPDLPQSGHTSYVQARQISAILAERFRNKPIDLVTHDDLDAWIKGLNFSPQTRFNYWSITARFFAWCHEKADLIVKNPMLKVDAPKVPYTPPEILSPDQMAICLETANDNPEHMAWLCLGGFCGLRSAEIYRMDWEDINWQDGIINVRKPKKVARWRPRFLEEEKPKEGDGPNARWFQTLRRHLEPLALKRGDITKEKRAEDFRVRVSMIMSWQEWPHNCLRHSFATYHVAIEKNFPKLQELMGHADPRLTKYIYSIAIPRAEAERWWRL